MLHDHLPRARARQMHRELERTLFGTREISQVRRFAQHIQLSEAHIGRMRQRICLKLGPVARIMNEQCRCSEKENI
jgi:hypothetical protein